MKILFYSLFMIYIILSNECAFSEKKGVEMLNNILELKINTDKEIYKIGDNIIIGCHIKNISKKEIKILPWYRHNWISFYDLNGKEIEKVSLIIYELKIIPDKKDFVPLAPNESFNTTFKGLIKKDGINLFSRNQRIEGLLIDFKDSAIILGKAGEYVIKAVYEGEQFWKEEGEKRYNFTNIWTGKIDSNEIKIRIVE